MDTKKLFQVLVAGGALLATACFEEDEPPRADAGAGTDAPLASDDTSSPAPDAEPTNCGLCPNPECCVTEPDGTSHEHAGMVCCWGTSC